MKFLLERAKIFALGIWRRIHARPWRSAGLALAAVPVLMLLYVLVLIPFTPSIGDIRKSKSEKPAVVMSADGEELALFKRANRDWVKLADISPNVLSALIATEDHRFFEHHGLDIRRTTAAVWHTLSGDRQGGSTLSQQLARNLYPEDIGRAPTITRKIKEAITALKIEAVYSKKEILETYLNTVPFLYNAFGIEMAARTYFDKSASKLDVLEAATLIGMLKGTSYYNPVINPERAVQRRNIVLAQMVKHQKLDAAQFETMKKQQLKVDFERQNEPLGPAPHLTQQMRRWLIDWADRNGYNIYADGLVVQTTIDSRLQEQANQAVTRQADKLQTLADAHARSGWTKELVQTLLRETVAYRTAREAGATDEQVLKQLQADTALMQALRQDKTRLQAGFLAMDPHNGHVKAWVGSREFSQDQFDHVQQARRQPGSTFKPFVYGAAFEQGARSTDTLVDQAVEIQIDRTTVWRPGDATAPSGRTMTLREGLMYSKNTITAQLMQNVGPSRVANLARAMGVRQSKLELVPSLALGTSPVTLKEMVSAYGTIANGGNFVEPVLVTRVEDRNRTVLEEFHPRSPEPALSHAVSQTLIDVLRGAIDQGTGAGIRTRFGIQADVAGKTGTTQDNTDAWFVLMHPQLVAGAWVGFNDNRLTMRHDWGQGSQSALPIVGDFFQQAFKSKVVDSQARFAAPKESKEPVLQDPSLWGRVNDWLGGVFASEPPRPPDPLPSLPPLPPVALPELPQPRVPDMQVESAPPLSSFPPMPQSVPVVPAAPPAAASSGIPAILMPEAGMPRRMERAPQVVLTVPQQQRPPPGEGIPVREVARGGGPSPQYIPAIPARVEAAPLGGPPSPAPPEAPREAAPPAATEGGTPSQ